MSEYTYRPKAGFVVTHFLTVSDVAHSADFYTRVLGGKTVRDGEPTILLAIEQQPIAGSCSSLLLQLGALSARQPALASKESVGEQVADCQRTVPPVRR